MKRLTRSEIRLGLSIRECESIIDALEEWEENVGAKELEENEVGLTYERFLTVRGKLKMYLNRMKWHEDSPTNTVS
jgi:hypothetical protein